MHEAACSGLKVERLTQQSGRVHREGAHPARPSPAEPPVGIILFLDPAWNFRQRQSRTLGV